jgi:hypothetical protein
MKNENKFEALIMQARSESAPSVDVADRVIAFLTAEHERLENVSDRPLMWLAAFSSAVAVPAVITAVIIYNNWVGPLYEISQAIAWVTQ